LPGILPDFFPFVWPFFSALLYLFPDFVGLIPRFSPVFWKLSFFSFNPEHPVAMD